MCLDAAMRLAHEAFTYRGATFHWDNDAFLRVSESFG